MTPLMMMLFTLSFLVTLAFSPIQTISPQFYVDMFQFNASQISYVLIVVGLTSIIYQGFLIKYVRKYLKEVSMILVGIVLLMVSFILQGYNTSVFWLWFILPLFPLGMGAIQPSISSLVARDAGPSTGKYLGMNNSFVSLGNIAGPTLAGYLYTSSIILPYWVSAGLFIFSFIFAYITLRPTK